MSRMTKKKTALVTALMLFTGGGIAVAYWSAGGSGSGTAPTKTTVALVVNQTTPLAEMYPGDSAQTISGNFDNPNSGPVYVTSVTASIASVTKATNAPAGTCDATDYTLANASMTVGAEVAAGTGQGSWSGATIKFNNKTTNQDACKGATVTLSYAAS